VTGTREIQQLIEKAAEFHGHLGPFLVIGVRIGEMATRHLGVDNESSNKLQASIRTRPFTPFFCVIDGIQASTRCTVGNRKLKIEESTEETIAHFGLQGSDKAVTVTVNSKVAEALIKEMSEGADPEQLAAKVSQMREEQLFVLEEC
jgi:formylmethanofuran dehydrogenase subunit E